MEMKYFELVKAGTTHGILTTLLTTLLTSGGAVVLRP